MKKQTTFIFSFAMAKYYCYMPKTNIICLDFSDTCICIIALTRLHTVYAEGNRSFKWLVSGTAWFQTVVLFWFLHMVVAEINLLKINSLALLDSNNALCSVSFLPTNQTCMCVSVLDSSHLKYDVCHDLVFFIVSWGKSPFASVSYWVWDWNKHRKPRASPWDGNLSRPSEAGFSVCHWWRSKISF